MKEKNGEHPFGDAGQFMLAVLFIMVWATDSFPAPIDLPVGYNPVKDPAALHLACDRDGALSRVVGPFGDQPQTKTGRYKGDGRVPLREASSIPCQYSVLSRPGDIDGIAFFPGPVSRRLCLSNYIAGYEERLLEVKFGNEYLNYKNKTARWLPGVF